jgi:ADP-heptose:LPS heptosyltransferase
MLIKKKLSKNKTINSVAVSLREFYQKRNRVLITRNARGLGDILMHRLIFEDFKRVMPDMHLTFACPRTYFDAIKDHPFIDEVVDSTHVNKNNFLISYDTSNCCIRWECAHAPHASKNRADIWAEHCGVTLTKHNMHVPFITKDMLQFGIFQVRQARGMALKLFKPNSPNILFTPIAFDNMRTLTNDQITGVVKYLKNKGCFVYSTHHVGVPLLEELGVTVFSGYSIPQWFSFIHAADYVVSADTSTFHYAGGIKKPLVGIFTHADGKYRGQYYDFILVQKHRDEGNWPCGPCYNYAMCTHPNGKCTGFDVPKPCLTELTVKDIIDGIEKMFIKYPK